MSWVAAAPESRELLALCLKKLRGLQKVRIVDASFIWTEPHSRRVRVKLTVQDTVSDGVLLQQSFEVIYVVAWQQCPECWFALRWTGFCYVILILNLFEQARSRTRLMCGEQVCKVGPIYRITEHRLGG